MTHETYLFGAVFAPENGMLTDVPCMHAKDVALETNERKLVSLSMKFNLNAPDGCEALVNWPTDPLFPPTASDKNKTSLVLTIVAGRMQ